MIQAAVIAFFILLGMIVVFIPSMIYNSCRNREYEIINA